ncbi:hypothetical protein [Lottiidibacillus patelloidae]|nr:hypothetical protein [Lottiidibacillus patelloidae]
MSRLSINESDSEFDEKFHTWRMAENRYLRTNQLIDLNAPKFIKVYEISWLATMIDHLDKRHKGIEPKFTEEQLEELEDQIRFQSIFD